MPYRYDNREEHRGLAFFLAVTMHALLAAFLLISVQWQTRKPETISVELWGALPAQSQESVEPTAEEVMPAPLPVQESLPEVPPEIVTEKIKPKPTPKPTAQPTPRATSAPSRAPTPTGKPASTTGNKPPAEDAFLKALQGGMSERSKGPATGGSAVGTGGGSQPGASGAGAGANAMQDDYQARLVALFKSRLIYPDDNAGNPQVSLRISVLPDGSIRDVTILKASNDPAYDLAAVRAVRAVDRLPEPGRGRSFRDADLREFTVNFRLRDK